MDSVYVFADETAAPGILTRLGELVRENATILIPVALGFVGVYFLLPQGRRSRPVLGGLVGAIALVLAGWYLVAVQGPIPETILFYAFAGLAILGGGLMISQRNPVHAALSFALVVLATCGIFLLNAAPFLMAATIIVYAGAIVVTFLFVIMLAQQGGISEADQRSREPFLASLAGFVLVGGLLCVIHRSYQSPDQERILAKVQQLAKAETASDVNAMLGNPPEKDAPLWEEFAAIGASGEDVTGLESAWGRRDPDLPAIRKHAARVLEQGKVYRAWKGTLIPAANLPLSAQSGTPANAPSDERKPLPASNVAAIGRSLFTDYLVPVNLAGMLLLVATIGAIAIAGRRPEGLR